MGCACHLMDRIIWLPTITCNLRCPYCITVNISTKYAHRKAEEWLKILDEVPPSIIDISGGEPTLLPKFAWLINNIPNKHDVAITSNLTEFDEILKINRKLISLMCSLHLTEKEQFFDKLATLRNLGYPVSVNYVMFPEQIKYSEEYKKQTKELGVAYHEEKCIFVNDLKRVKNVTKCEAAGNHYFHWMPNGDVYACVTGWYYNMHVEKAPEFYLGNLFDGTFQPRNSPLPCNLDCVMACDLQQRGIVKP